MRSTEGHVPGGRGQPAIIGRSARSRHAGPTRRHRTGESGGAATTFQLLPHRGASALDQHRHDGQIARKTPNQLYPRAPRAGKTCGRAAWQMGESRDIDAPGHRLVRDHQIKSGQSQQQQQFAKLSLAGDNAERRGHRQCRLEQTVGNRRDDKIRHTKSEIKHPITAGDLWYCGAGFVTQGKHPGSVSAIGGLTPGREAQPQTVAVGQLNSPHTLAKKLCVKPTLQILKLVRQGLRRGVQ